MSVEKRILNSGDVVWRVRWREGNRNRAPVLGRKSDAIAFEAEVRRRARTGELRLLDAGREALDAFAAEWLRAYGRVNLAPRTLAYYGRVWDLHISSRIGGLRLREVDVEVCQRFAADLAADGLGAAMRRKVLTIRSGVLQRAFEWGRIPANPMRAVRFPSNKRRREIRALSPATVEAMRTASELRDATLISVLAYGGLRPQEALALCWRRVGERTISVHAPKTGRRRSVRLLAPLGEDLAAWREERPADGLVFPGRNGEPWTTEAYKSWSSRAPRGRKGKDGKRAGGGGAFGRAAKAAGVPEATPYSLRHSFCSLLLHEGRSVIYVADQLGHGAQLSLETSAI